MEIRIGARSILHLTRCRYISRAFKNLNIYRGGAGGRKVSNMRRKLVYTHDWLAVLSNLLWTLLGWAIILMRLLGRALSAARDTEKGRGCEMNFKQLKASSRAPWDELSSPRPPAHNRDAPKPKPPQQLSLSLSLPGYYTTYMASRLYIHLALVCGDLTDAVR